MDVSSLPTVNALLNSLSALLLSFGYYFIRQRETRRHQFCMVAAFVVSCFFLSSYLTYHYHAGSVPFLKQGWIRPFYFTILITHVLLAASIVPLALATLYFAWRKRFNRHKLIARWTLPIWMYVSVTGVVIYWMLYKL